MRAQSRDVSLQLRALVVFERLESPLGQGEEGVVPFYVFVETEELVLDLGIVRAERGDTFEGVNGPVRRPETQLSLHGRLVEQRDPDAVVGREPNSAFEHLDLGLMLAPGCVDALQIPQRLFVVLLLRQSALPGLDSRVELHQLACEQERPLSRRRIGPLAVGERRTGSEPPFEQG
jgi:hypothetical protein